MIRLSLLCFCLLWGGFALGQSPDSRSGENSEATTANTILVLGDSLSAAYGIPAEAGWVNLLRQRLQAEGYQYRVVNASISGETSSGGLTRLPALLSEHQPSVVLIELGANDGLRGLSLKRLRENLRSMIAQSREAGAQVLLLGVRLPLNYGKAFLTRFLALYQNLAQELQLAYVPYLLKDVAEHRERMLEDGIHPRAEAQSIVLDNVWVGLADLLKKP